MKVTLSQFPAQGEISTATADFSETPAKLPFDLRVAEDCRLLGTAWTPTDDPRCADGACPGTAQNDHRDICLTLPDVRARLLVVRGCGFTCTVQVGKDHPVSPQPPLPLSVDQVTAAWLTLALPALMAPGYQAEAVFYRDLAPPWTAHALLVRQGRLRAGHRRAPRPHGAAAG